MCIIPYRDGKHSAFLFFMNLLFSVTVYLVKAYKGAVAYGEAVKKNVEEKLCTDSAFFTAREPGQHYVKKRKDYRILLSVNMYLNFYEKFKKSFNYYFIFQRKYSIILDERDLFPI